MGIVDTVVICLIFFFLVNGWRKGFLRSVITPLCFLIFSLIAIVHYDLTDNAIKSFFLAVIGGSVASTLLRIIVFFSIRNVDKDYRNASFILSRMLGAVLNGLWQGMILLLVLIILPFFPSRLMGFPELRETIRESLSYQMGLSFFLEKIPAARKLIEVLWVIENPSRIVELSDTPEYQDLIHDKNIQEFLDDPQIAECLRTKNIPYLLSHPKVLQLFKNGPFIDKLNRLGMRIYEQGLKKEIVSGKNPP